MNTPQLQVLNPHAEWQQRLTWRQAALKGAYHEAVQSGSQRRQQLVIAEAYHLALPYILQHGLRGRIVQPNLLDWVLGEVQQDAWCMIRSHALPLYPNFPVLGYFVSFADPFRRLAVEVEPAPGYWVERETEAQNATFLHNGWQLCRLPYEVATCDYDDVLPEHLQGTEVNGYADDAQHDERRAYDAELARRTMRGFFDWLARHGCYSPAELRKAREQARPHQS